MKYTIRSFQTHWSIFRIDENDEEVTVAEGRGSKFNTELKKLLQQASIASSDEEVLIILKDSVNKA